MRGRDGAAVGVVEPDQAGGFAEQAGEPGVRVGVRECRVVQFDEAHGNALSGGRGHLQLGHPRRVEQQPVLVRGAGHDGQHPGVLPGPVQFPLLVHDGPAAVARQPPWLHDRRIHHPP
ncbi:hypothetical protein GCM10009530_58900 [Microbispora corallina]